MEDKKLQNDKVNILLMGTSGAGKSTLINAIIPSAHAPTGIGSAVTKEMKSYTENNSPLILIDSVGYELNFIHQLRIKNEVNRWSKKGVKTYDPSKYIQMIWFCIDGQSKRIFKEVLDGLWNVSRIWKDIPIIIVFTKAYGSEEDDEECKEMFFSVLQDYRHRNDLNIKRDSLISVVAMEKDTPLGTIPQKGLDKLVHRTKELIPESIKNTEKALTDIELRIKKTEANAVIAISSASSAAIGAIPLPVPDASVLVPTQGAMVKAISRIYDIRDEKMKKSITNTLMELGATTMAGKSLVMLLKRIPGISIAGTVIDAVVAGIITATLGISVSSVYDRIFRGQLDISAYENISNALRKSFQEKLPQITELIGKTLKNQDIKELPKMIHEIIKKYLENQ